jgi:hypothetical protein
MRIHFIGQSKLTTFGEGRMLRKRGDDEYVKMDFKGHGGVGKTKLKLPSVKQDMAIVGGLGGLLGVGAAYNKGWKTKVVGGAIGAGLGAGTAYLLRKRARDIDGRSDKGKKRK